MINVFRVLRVNTERSSYGVVVAPPKAARAFVSLNTWIVPGTFVAAADLKRDLAAVKTEFTATDSYACGASAVYKVTADIGRLHPTQCQVSGGVGVQEEAVRECAPVPATSGVVL